MKKCSKCGEIKSIEYFNKNQSTRASSDGLQNQCKLCQKINTLSPKNKKSVAERNKTQHIKSYKHSWHILNKYGLTVEQYNQRLESQNNCCAICKKPQKDENRAFAVDHCHKNKYLRGLLCMHCNSALGKFYDNISLLESAILYLKYYQA